MRNRRIVIIVLAVLTVLAGIDLRYNLISGADRGISGFEFKISINDSDRYPAHTKSQSLVVPIDGIKELSVINDMGETNVYGADTDQITITGSITVSAETEEEAQAYAESLTLQVDQTDNRAELRLIEPQRPKEIKNVKVNYEITMPKNMALAVDAEYNKVHLENLTGAVQIWAGFSSVTAKNLIGSVGGSFDFSNVEFDQFGGSLYSENNFSNLELYLAPESSGFTFNVEVDFGVLSGNVDLERQETGESLINAKGKIGDGKNQVTVSASFSNVDIYQK